MSTSTPEPQVESLLKQGIEAARAGNKAVARAMLEQVVEADQQNEKGWFWLAAVTDDLHEKRVCLGNVIVINPNNERARRLLEQLETHGTMDSKPSRPGLEPSGPNRSTVYVAIALGGIAVVVLLVLVVLMMSGGKKKSDGTPAATLASFGGTPAAGDTTQIDDQGTPLGVPTILPTETMTPLPPTWTPVPSNTPAPALPPTMFAPAPSTLTGMIVMRSGQVPGDPNNQPIALIKPDGTNQRTITPGTERGHDPVLSPDGSQYAYILYAPGTREQLLQFDNFLGTAPRPASRYWTGVPTLQNQESPSWSADGQWIAFVAQGMGSATVDLFRLSLATPDGAPEALERLTSDDAIESWPAYSPDGRWIVYAADLKMLSLEAATELRIYDTTTKQITNLTTNGAELIEASPDWSPDGSTIVFQAQEAGSSQNDIFMIPSSGTAPAEKIIESDANDIAPRFSPDGGYIVFSSDRTGNWDVFIYEIATQTIYQVTTGPHTDIANDWGQ
jgi:Tol biopolymer transport system component